MLHFLVSSQLVLDDMKQNDRVKFQLCARASHLVKPARSRRLYGSGPARCFISWDYINTALRYEMHDVTSDGAKLTELI